MDLVEASWIKYPLRLKFEAGTSRGVMTSKISYFIFLRTETGVTGIGECSLLPGLSIDDRPGYEDQLIRLCENFKQSNMGIVNELSKFLEDRIGHRWPSMRMAFEMAGLDLIRGGERVIFQNGFLKGEGIPINGLIWMGDRKFMLQQIKRKIESGYTCIKMKIGAMDYDIELDLLRYIRKQFQSKDLILRVDANGAFTPQNVMEKLGRLEKLNIHSIEQPIEAGQWEQMHKLCRITPIPVGLDEELIGEYDIVKKKDLVQQIMPHYLILKPSLLGGFDATREWIHIAESHNIGWWITSALESNIGLNAICQFTYGLKVTREQGLGTGQLFSNNIESPLEVNQGEIRYRVDGKWDLSNLGVETVQ